MHDRDLCIIHVYLSIYVNVSLPYDDGEGWIKCIGEGRGVLGGGDGGLKAHGGAQ